MVFHSLPAILRDGVVLATGAAVSRFGRVAAAVASISLPRRVVIGSAIGADARVALAGVEPVALAAAARFFFGGMLVWYDVLDVSFFCDEFVRVDAAESISRVSVEGAVWLVDFATTSGVVVKFVKSNATAV